MTFRYSQAEELISAADKLSINYSVLDVAANFDNLSNQEFVIIDTETTGFDWEIIEIWAVTVKNNCIRMKDGRFLPYHEAYKQIHNVDFFGTLIYPTPQIDSNGNEFYYIPELISSLTHIDIPLMDRSANEPMPNKSFRDFATPFFLFLDYVGDRPMVGHNLSFDIWRFADAISRFRIYEIFDYMRIVEEETGDVLDAKLDAFCNGLFIDTLKDAKKILKINSEPNHKNGSLATRYGLVPNEETLHRAYYDTFFTGSVFFGLIEDARKYYQEISNLRTK